MGKLFRESLPMSLRFAKTRGTGYLELFLKKWIFYNKNFYPRALEGLFSIFLQGKSESYKKKFLAPLSSNQIRPCSFFFFISIAYKKEKGARSSK
jgi:hypothetical protein